MKFKISKFSLSVSLLGFVLVGFLHFMFLQSVKYSLVSSHADGDFYNLNQYQFELLIQNYSIDKSELKDVTVNYYENLPYNASIVFILMYVFLCVYLIYKVKYIENEK